MLEIIHTFFFLGALVFSLLVLFAQRTFYNVLSLMGLFFSVGVLFMLIESAFIGLTLIIVYVGAVTVFFLFAVMMFGSALEQKVSTPRGANTLYATFGIAWLGLCTGVVLWSAVKDGSYLSGISLHTSMGAVDIGRLLYTQYIVPFQLTGLTLFLAIIGGISLVLRHRSDTKRQEPFAQIAQSDAKSVTALFVPSRKGLKDVQH